MSRLLLDDKPLIVLPSLAERVGLNEAIILQQLHYWLGVSTNKKEGFTWVYNTYDDWKEQFPFWSVSTIRRAISKLEDAGIIATANYNKLPIDKTKWYRINYEMLDGGLNSPSVQNEQSSCSKRTVELSNMNRPLPESTTENTTEKEKRDIGHVADAPALPFYTIIDYLNEKAGTSYRHASKKTQGLIRARFNDGFKTIDFKTVIDIKTAEWLPDPSMNKFIRPETLFGTKFESYLNQKPKGGSSHGSTPQNSRPVSNDRSGLDW